jgi:8-oxo-dGTP diphosphatase
MKNPKAARLTKQGSRRFPDRVDPIVDQSERDFLATYDPSAFPHPSVTVDVALISITHQKLTTFVVRRTEYPQRGSWALPGGFVRFSESLDAAAARVLSTKAGLRNVFLEQLYTFGEPGRDPRTRIITVAYYALVNVDRFMAADSESGRPIEAWIDVPWEGEAGGPVDVADTSGAPLELAFDHADILGMAVKRLRGKLDYTPIGFQLLPDTFTLRQLQEVHETILGRRLNKDSFRRRMLASGLLKGTGKRQDEVGHRPAELFRFVKGAAV